MAIQLRQLGRASLVGSALLASLLATASAYGATTPNPIASVKTNPALAAKVISSIRKSGTLVVAADATYAPNEFVQSGQVVGMDADLAAGIAKVLNLKLSIINETFDGIIPGLAAKKYSLGMSSFTDTKLREKTVDFVDYFSAGTSFFVLSKGGPAIATLANLCGHTVAVEAGTTEEQDADTQSKACTSAGHAKVTVNPYPTQSEANLALKGGRDQVGMADSPVAAYQVKQSNGSFKLSGKAYGAAPYGIAIPKNNGMAPVILAAVKELMADGAYTKILNKWGVESGAIATAGINGATS
jgi:polar amino acid transport system substrate-binding protein